jgi:hypothetical protein
VFLNINSSRAGIPLLYFHICVYKSMDFWVLASLFKKLSESL